MGYNNEMKACEGDCRAAVPEPTMADLMKEPACFRDELLKTRYTLFRLNNELHKMAHHLGTL